MVNQAQSVELPKRWPLVSPLQTRTSATPLTKGARLINGYAELDPATKEFEIWKRPGVSTTVAASGTTGLNGCGSYTHPPTGQLLWVTETGGSYNGYLYCSGAGSSPIATITMPQNTPTQVWFEAINSSPLTVAVGTGAAAYIVNMSSYAVTQVTDSAYPTQTVPGFVYLDTTLYTMDYYGNIWNAANPNSGLVWTPASEIQASATSDLGVCLVRQLSYVLAMKQTTIQVFYDAGNATGSPLGVVQDAQIPLGCLSANSVATMDSTVMFLTSNQSMQPQVAQLDNLTPKIVSTPAVDRLLSQVLIAGGNIGGGIIFPSSGIWAFMLKIGGHRFYVLNLIINNLTLVYDVDQELWYIWTDPSGNFWPYVSVAYSAPTLNRTGLHYIQHINNGNIYYVDGNWKYPNDSGSPIGLDLYTISNDFGTVRQKDLNMLYFNGDKVPGSKLLVRHSNDDFSSWSNFREVDLSLNKPRLWNNGSFHRRAYHLRHLSNCTFRLKSMDCQMDIGTQ